MKITTTKQSLTAALERCSPTSSTRGHHIHSGKVLLTATEYEDGVQQLRLYATDAVLQVDTVAEAQVSRAGNVAVDCRKLLTAVGAMPEGEISLLFAQARLVLKSPTSPRSYGLPAVPGDDYPTPIEPHEGAPRLQVEGKVLHRAISRVQSIIEVSEKLHLYGVRIEADPDRLFSIAMSNHSFAICSTAIEGLAGGWTGLLPASGLRLVLNLCNDNEQLTLISDGPQVYIETDITLVGSLTPSGDYPPWRKLFDGLQRTSRAEVGFAQLQDALKAVMVARADQESPVRLQVQGEQLILSLEKDSCEATDQFAVVAPNGDYSVLMNPLYLSDITKGAEGDFLLEESDIGPVISTEDGYTALAAMRHDEAPPPAGQK